jgi:hypothetical protein
MWMSCDLEVDCDAVADGRLGGCDGVGGVGGVGGGGRGLVSDSAASITGGTLEVAGGYLMM